MADILAEICDHKRTEVAARKARHSEMEIRASLASASPVRGFTSTLRAGRDKGYGLIAEIKKASPSKGLIRADFDPPVLAQAYRDGGASCLSVLTDSRYFQGHDDYLLAARAAVDLPVLRKDFMVDAYQIYEARAMGADCILLIMAALDDREAQDFEALAHELGMDVLIEVHDRDELDRALALKSPLLGVNNRNLKTMVTDIAQTEALAPMVPADRIMISESGLYSREDLARMAAVGARCFLIGESLMRQTDVASATKDLLATPLGVAG